MSNHYELDVPCKILKDDFDTSAYPDFGSYHWAVWNDQSERYLTQECKKLLADWGICDQVWFDNKLQQNHVVVFRGNKNQFMDIHCDRGPSWGINLVWGASHSDMVWYEPFNDTATDNAMCSVGSEYQKYDPEQCCELERTSSHGPMLVRIDIPHNVINYDKDNYRWCLSIRDLNNKWTWDEAVEHFKPWFKHD
jgi:hypothetical protein